MVTLICTACREIVRGRCTCHRCGGHDTMLDMGLRAERAMWRRMARAARVARGRNGAAAWPTVLGGGLGIVAGTVQLGASLVSAGLGTLVFGVGALLAWNLERAPRPAQAIGVWPPLIDASGGVEGVVRGGASVGAPATGRACAAYTVSLYDLAARGGPLLVSESYTPGFEIVTPSGDVLRVPGGWIRVGGSSGAEVIGRRRRAYLRGVFGWPAPKGRLVERVLEDGSRVRIVGRFAAPLAVGCAPYRGRVAADRARVAHGPIYVEEVAA